MNGLYKGMTIIRKYTQNEKLERIHFAAEHDQIWCGEFNGDKMSRYDKEDMDFLGWFEDAGAWSKYV